MASSSRPAVLLPCILAVFVCLAGLGDATNPLETHQQPLPTAPRSGVLVEGKIAFGHPNSGDHVLRLPTEREDSISMENLQEQPVDVDPKGEPRFPLEKRPFVMPFHGELPTSRSQNQREIISRQFPFRFGRPGGCHHSRHRADYAHRYFPGNGGPDSIALRRGTFHVFPTERESAESRPDRRFGPADMGETTPYDSSLINEDVPTQHLHWAFSREAVAERSHEEPEEGPAGRWMGRLSSFFLSSLKLPSSVVSITVFY